MRWLSYDAEGDAPWLAVAVDDGPPDEAFPTRADELNALVVFPCNVQEMPAITCPMKVESYGIHKDRYSAANDRRHTIHVELR